MRSLRPQSDHLAIAGLALLAVVFWGNCLWGGKVPVAAVYQKQMLPWSAVSEAGGETRQWDSLLWDSMAQFYPWRVLLHNAAKEGQLPLWNPYQFCGYPFVGNGQSAMFYPPNWLYLVLHPSIGMGLSAALHFFLGSLFVFGLARTWRLSVIPATFAAIAFAYGGFMVTWIELPTLVNSLIWIPLAWWGIELILRAQGPSPSPMPSLMEGPATSRPAASPLPEGPHAEPHPASGPHAPAPRMVHGLLMLTTALGLTLLAGHFQIAAYVWIFATIYAIIRLIALRRATRRLIATIAIAVALAGALAAVQLLPTLELGQRSARGAGGPSAGGFEFHRQRALQPLELLTLLQADFLGTPVDGTYKGISYSEHCPFVGATTILLGLLGLALGWRRKSLWLFCGIAIFALWGAMAGPPAMLLYWGVPKLGQAGGFSRLLSIWTLAAALWGAFGLQVLLDRLAVSLPSSVGRGLVPRRPSSATTSDGAVRARALQKTAVAAIALLLLALELLPWAYRFNPRADAASVYPETAAIQKLRDVTGPNRYVAVNDRRKWGLADVPTGVVLPPNAATVYGLRCVDGYDSLFPLAYRQHAAAVEGADPSPLANGNMLLLEKGLPWAMDACPRVVSSATGESALPGVRLTWQGDGVSFGRVSHGAAPRAQLAQQPAFLFSSFPYNELPLPVDDLNHVRVDISSSWIQALDVPDKPAHLTLHDASYPGWHAYVDGLEVPIAAEATARTVAVTTGARTVDFVYFPASVAAGLFVSLLALMALAALATSRLGRWTR
ncbi:MAG: hypothetical protein ACYC63_09225 [Armatimonadota bacterium]